MVVAGTRRSWSGLGMDYSGPNDLLRFGPHLAESRVDCPGEIAGNGNRTRMASLEGWNFTIKLCPRGIKLPRCATNANSHFSKVGGNRPPTRNTGFLFLECGRDQRGVVAAKTERVT